MELFRSLNIWRCKMSNQTELFSTSQIPLPGFEADTVEEMVQAMDRNEDILLDVIDARARLLDPKK